MIKRVVLKSFIAAFILQASVTYACDPDATYYDPNCDPDVYTDRDSDGSREHLADPDYDCREDYVPGSGGVMPVC